MAKKLTHAEYLALPQPKKAVLLAKDVIAHVRTQKLNVACGMYCGVEENLMEGADFDERWDKANEVQSKLDGLGEESAKDHLKEILPACTVCAKGALFVSRIRLFNNVPTHELVHADSYSLEDRMVTQEETFDKRTFDLIETAFERAGFGEFHPRHDGDFHSNAIKRAEAIDFGARFKKPAHRVVAIMLNIIKNKGTFDPTVRVTREEVREALRVAKR